MSTTLGLFSVWSVDHAFAVLAGILISFLVLMPLGLLVYRLIRGRQEPRSALEERASRAQEGWDTEKARVAELIRTVEQLNRQIVSLRGVRDKWAKDCANQGKATGVWKVRCEQVAEKHNTLVRKHNALVSRFNDLGVAATAKLGKYHDQVSTLERERQRLAAAKEELERHLQDATLQADVLSVQNRDLHLRTQYLGEETAKLAGEITDLRAKMEDLDRTLPALLGKVAALADALRELDRGKQAAVRQAEDLGRDNEALQREISELRQESVGVRQTNQELTTRNQSLALQNKDLREKHAAASQTVDRLIRENQELRDQLQAFRRDAESSTTLAPAGHGEGEEWQGDGADTDGEPEPDQADGWAAPAWVGTRAIHLGLDFGTHSTKVMARVRGEDIARVLCLDEPAPGYPGFVIPSLVRLTGGKLYFGGRALQLTDGTLFPSLKVSLLPPSRDGRGGAGEFPPGTTPDLLVAVYLSWVLGQVKAMLGNGQLPKLSLNVAAPMNYWEEGALRERYLHVVQAAWQATFGAEPLRVTQGINLTKLRTAFRSLLEAPVLDLETRRFEILPETMAPLVSLLQDPRTTPGFYMMVDMGAGTTELSFSHINERGENCRILCYADQWLLLGGNQFNLNDETNRDDRDTHVREEERLKKEFLRAFRSTWHDGFSKENTSTPALKARLKQLNVILSGGGLRRKCLETTVWTHSPLDTVFRYDKTEYCVSWHCPAHVEFFGRSLAFDSDSLAYLAVAHGLSLERKYWPEPVPPEQVDRPHRPPRVVDPLVYWHHE